MPKGKKKTSKTEFESHLMPDLFIHICIFHPPPRFLICLPQFPVPYDLSRSLSLSPSISSPFPITFPLWLALSATMGPFVGFQYMYFPLASYAHYTNPGSGR